MSDRFAIGGLGDRLLGVLLRPLRKAMGARLGTMRRHRKTVVEDVAGLPIIVLPDVFNPVLFESGALLARVARREIRSRRQHEPPRVLDLGTGSGVAAVFAAMAGAQVEAIDVNPQAVRCARLNAQLHHLEDRIDVREGDLFAPVEGRRYDLVLFNPPFHRGSAETFLEAAMRSEDVFERFAEGLSDALEPGGEALVVLSTEGDCDEAVWRLRAEGFGLDEIERTRWYGALLVVMRARQR